MNNRLTALICRGLYSKAYSILEKNSEEIKYSNENYGEWYTPDSGSINKKYLTYYFQWNTEKGTEIYKNNTSGHTFVKSVRTTLKYFRISTSNKLFYLNIGCSNYSKWWFDFHIKPITNLFNKVKSLGVFRKLKLYLELGHTQYFCSHKEMCVGTNINGDSGSETHYCPTCGYKDHIQYY